jgi:hypothetical protein
MDNKRITYYCPYSATCKLHKNCHVLTTATELSVPITVWQLCVAEGKNPDGTKKEIQVIIGTAA